MMKKHLKKGMAGFLTLVLTLSALTCLATASADGDDGDGTTAVTVYITCDKKEIRPGHDSYVDIKYTISPVTDLTYFRFTVTEPEGLTFRTFTDTSASYAETMFGAGEFTDGDRIIQSYAYDESYGGHPFSCKNDYYLFSARYNITEDLEEGEVTFGLENASVRIQGVGSVDVVTETVPVPVVIVSTTTLERMVTSAESLLELKENYSDASVANLEKALADAQNILDNIEDYYQVNVDQAVDALSDAMNGLKSPEEELKEAIDLAEGLRESDYKTESWGNMKDALQAAKEIRDKENATNDERNGAANALYEAIDALVPVDDSLAASREALEHAVETVKGLNQDDYSESAWAALQTALENAEKVLSDENATKDELDESYDALALALARANLEMHVDTAKQLSSSNYTADSWETLQTALANAEEVLNNEDATQAELEDADDALVAALNGLVTSGNGNPSASGGSGNGNGSSTTSGITSPQTGDSNLLLMCMIVLSAGMVCCSAVCVSKARGRRE